MTNYNDDKWHGWNGGECPVHPKTIVDAVTTLVALPASVAGAIGGWEADHSNPIVAFRVVKEYREPREWWCVGEHMHTTFDAAARFLADLQVGNPGMDFGKVYRVVEVLE